MFFLRDLKEACILITRWKKGFTKNLATSEFEKCIVPFVGNNTCNKEHSLNLRARESVGAKNDARTKSVSWDKNL